MGGTARLPAQPRRRQRLHLHRAPRPRRGEVGTGPTRATPCARDLLGRTTRSGRRRRTRPTLILSEQVAWWGIEADTVVDAAEANPLLEDGAGTTWCLLDRPRPRGSAPRATACAPSVQSTSPERRDPVDADELPGRRARCCELLRRSPENRPRPMVATADRRPEAEQGLGPGGRGQRREPAGRHRAALRARLHERDRGRRAGGDRGGARRRLRRGPDGRPDAAHGRLHGHPAHPRAPRPARASRSSR